MREETKFSAADWADCGQKANAATDEASEMALLPTEKNKPERRICLSGYIPTGFFDEDYRHIHLPAVLVWH